MPPPIPNVFPQLPSIETAWSYNVQSAHHILSNSYRTAIQVLRQEEGDVLRLRHHSRRIRDNLVPILESLETDGLAEEWVVNCACILGGLMVELEAAALGAEEQYV
jgi:hypothetical protein